MAESWLDSSIFGPPDEILSRLIAIDNANFCDTITKPVMRSAIA
jgi:hypothetical protein